MSASTFRFQILVPKQVRPNVGAGRALEREDFFAWIWAHFAERGLLGVHEGTLLSEAAAEQGLETESWTVDSAEAPRERDWVGNQKLAEATLYFDSLSSAEEARQEFETIAGLAVGEVSEEKHQDWDAKWKASFLANPEGVRVRPFWRIIPPWVESSAQPTERVLKINPGAGFGTGTHETTQLCLEAIGNLHAKSSLAGKRVLDFGSGSGILAIGAALLDAEVDAVEIDPLAIENAEENARLNGVETRIQYSCQMSPDGSYPLVIANILRPVLLEFADALVSRLVQGGTLILSGLIERDVEEVSVRYSALLGREPVVGTSNEWRSLVW